MHHATKRVKGSERERCGRNSIHSSIHSSILILNHLHHHHHHHHHSHHSQLHPHFIANLMSSASSKGLNTPLSHTPYSPKPQLVYHPPHDAIDNQPNQNLSLLQQPANTLHEPSAPPYSQQLHTKLDQEEPSAPIDDPIRQQIIELEQDPTSAPIDDEDNISLAAPIYDPTAVAAPYLTYRQEPTFDFVDTSGTLRNRIALIAFIVQLIAFLSWSIYTIVLWVGKVNYVNRSNPMPGVAKTMAPVFFYAILMIAFFDR